MSSNQTLRWSSQDKTSLENYRKIRWIFLLLLLHTLYLLRITGHALTLLSKDDHWDYPPLCHISTQLASTWIHYQYKRLLNITSTQVWKIIFIILAHTTWSQQKKKKKMLEKIQKPLKQRFWQNICYLPHLKIHTVNLLVKLRAPTTRPACQ